MSESFATGGAGGHAFVTILTASRRADAEPLPGGDGWLLRYAKMARITYPVMAGVFGLLAAGAWTARAVGSPPSAGGAAFAGIVFSLLFLLGLYCAWACRRTVAVKEGGLEFRSPGFAPVDVPWSDLAELRYEPGFQALLLRRHDGRTHRIWIYTMDGVGRLFEVLARRVPELLRASPSLQGVDALRLIPPIQADAPETRAERSRGIRRLLLGFAALGVGYLANVWAMGPLGWPTIDVLPKVLAFAAGVLAAAAAWRFLPPVPGGALRGVLNPSALAFGVAFLAFAANALLDPSDAAEREAVVRGFPKGGEHVLRLSSWRPGEAELEVKAAWSFYRTLKVGTPVVVRTRRGLWGWEWIEGLGRPPTP